jgi:hypothetical protein
MKFGGVWLRNSVFSARDNAGVLRKSQMITENADPIQRFFELLGILHIGTLPI